MLAVASIPAILWALGMILLGIASDDLSAGLITALLSVIINFPLVVLLILPALLNKTDKKMANLYPILSSRLDIHRLDHPSCCFYQYE